MSSSLLRASGPMRRAPEEVWPCYRASDPARLGSGLGHPASFRPTDWPVGHKLVRRTLALQSPSRRSIDISCCDPRYGQLRRTLPHISLNHHPPEGSPCNLYMGQPLRCKLALRVELQGLASRQPLDRGYVIKRPLEIEDPMICGNAVIPDDMLVDHRGRAVWTIIQRF
jgi:hypothetical protein